MTIEAAAEDVKECWYVAKKKQIQEPDVSAPDDGLLSPDVGGWAEEKHRLVSLYAKLFSTGMKAKWDERIYMSCIPVQVTARSGTRAKS